jgi:hypothetical protein
MESGHDIPAPTTASKNYDDSKVVFSFELFSPNLECPSTWLNEEVKQLFSMFVKASQRTWRQVLQTSGKSHGGKVGLGYTPFKTDPFPRPQNVSADLVISELRVTDKARVFGCRSRDHFYIIRLDRGHQVCKEK